MEKIFDMIDLFYANVHLYKKIKEKERRNEQNKNSEIDSRRNQTN